MSGQVSQAAPFSASSVWWPSATPECPDPELPPAQPVNRLTGQQSQVGTVGASPSPLSSRPKCWLARVPLSSEVAKNRAFVEQHPNTGRRGANKHWGLGTTGQTALPQPPLWRSDIEHRRSLPLG